MITVQTKLSCAVAMFGMILRDSKFKSEASKALIKKLLKVDESILKNSVTAELLALVDQYKQ